MKENLGGRKLRVMKVKDKRSRERLERRLLKKRKVIAVISDIKDLKSELVRKANVVIVDESSRNDNSQTSNL